MQLCEFLQARRKKVQLSQQDIADILSCSPQVVSKWEKGTSQPDLSLFSKYADALKCPLKEFLSMENGVISETENPPFDAAGFCFFLTSLRKKQNLSQSGLSEKLGISSQLISKWERGVSLPDLNQFKMLCSYYHMEPSDFYYCRETEISEEQTAPGYETVPTAEKVRHPWFPVLGAVALIAVIAGSVATPILIKNAHRSGNPVDYVTNNGLSEEAGTSLNGHFKEDKTNAPDLISEYFDEEGVTEPPENLVSLGLMFYPPELPACTEGEHEFSDVIGVSKYPNTRRGGYYQYCLKCGTEYMHPEYEMLEFSNNGEITYEDKGNFRYWTTPYGVSVESKHTKDSSGPSAIYFRNHMEMNDQYCQRDFGDDSPLDIVFEYDGVEVEKCTQEYHFETSSDYVSIDTVWKDDHYEFIPVLAEDFPNQEELFVYLYGDFGMKRSECENNSQVLTLYFVHDEPYERETVTFGEYPQDLVLDTDGLYDRILNNYTISEDGKYMVYEGNKYVYTEAQKWDPGLFFEEGVPHCNTFFPELTIGEKYMFLVKPVEFYVISNGSSTFYLSTKIIDNGTCLSLPDIGEHPGTLGELAFNDLTFRNRLTYRANRTGYPTDYAIARGLWTAPGVYAYNESSYYIEDVNYFMQCGYEVWGDGGFDEGGGGYGGQVYNFEQYNGLRPVIRI